MKTSVDNLIRDSLRTEARQPQQTVQADRVLMQILQRAQTEIAQLPPDAPPEPALIHADPATRVPPITIVHKVAQTVPRISIADQIAEYREMMDMKMWRTIGPRAMRI